MFRAIATATGKTWDEVYGALCEYGKKLKRAPNEKQCYEKYLKDLGWVKHKTPTKYNGRKYTLEEFLDDFEFFQGSNAKAIVHVGAHHIAAVKYGMLYDTWDCTDRCVGVYWTK